jgi:hypothetical protein
MSSFPKSYQERETYILNQVLDGKAQFDVIKLSTEYNKHTIDLFVFCQPLRIDDVIINCNVTTQQNIADFLGFNLITEKIADLIWKKADFELEPNVRQITNSTQAMIEHSERIDKQLVGYDTKGKLIANGGKHWVIGNKATTAKAINYGWFVKTNTNSWKGIRVYPPASNLSLKVIQPASTCHNLLHVDYSQTCTLVSQSCKLDGEDINIYDLMKNVDLAKAISHEGVLNSVRQPGVTQEHFGVSIII